MHASSSTLLFLLAGMCTMACVEHSPVPLGPGECGPQPYIDYSVALTPNNDIDILFVIDDSPSMAQEQATLAANFASFVDLLERPELGFNYRIGITTTNNGNPWCWGPPTPEQGKLQSSSCRSRPEDFVAEASVAEGTPALDVTQEACNAVCPAQWAEIETLPTTTWEDDEARPRHWIERTAGVTNLPEGLSTAQALQCIGPQGIHGCSFESPLGAMEKAVQRSQIDEDPDFGFIRDHAMLLVVFVTDEEDCSYEPSWDEIFLPEPDEALPTSALCWNAGVACEGTSPYEDCLAVDLDVDGNPVPEGDADALAVLRPVSRYVEVLRQLEDRKQQIFPSQQVMVAVLSGVNSGGAVIYQDGAQDSSFQATFGIGPGCQSMSGLAAPPVRLRELAAAFTLGDQRNLSSICERDYTPVLEPIAERLADQLQPACMPTCVADIEPSTPDVLDPSCWLSQVPPAGLGPFESIEVPRCEPDATLPKDHDVCYVPLVGDELDEICADQGFNLEFQLVRREGVYVPPGAVILASCTTSQCTRGACE